MKTLPNDQWRAFIEFYLLEKPGHGAQTNAARRAGFGNPKTTPLNMARIASRLMRDPRMQAAIAEEGLKIVRGGAPEAAKALLNLIRNPDHRDHARGIAMLLDRSDPIISKQQIEVTHKNVDPDVEALEELRALRQLGTPREKLLELFGSNGLDRIEALERTDTARRAEAAKVIDGELVGSSQAPANSAGTLPHAGPEIAASDDPTGSEFLPDDELQPDQDEF
jgi:phage terminase small subunit